MTITPVSPTRLARSFLLGLRARYREALADSRPDDVVPRMSGYPMAHRDR